MIKELKSKGYDLKTIIAIVLLLIVISGILGYMHETIYFLIKLHKFEKRGSSFGPWIPIYAYGTLFILLFIYRFKNSKLLIFFLSASMSGILELIVGYLLNHFKHIRLWSYKNEILNIGGYTCLKAVLLFGLASLAFVYILCPIIIKLSNKINRKAFLFISYFLGLLFFIDTILYLFLK